MRWELLVKIGIGLPNPVPNTPGDLLVDWAQRAEAAGFSGLVTIDRIAYPSYDSLTSLAAAAGATKRISVMTNILLAPIYPPVLLAKTAASIDQISSGRFSLGLAAGGRSDDYEVTGRDFHRRGREFASQIAESAHRSVSQLRDVSKGFEDAGFTELNFDPTVATLDQIDRLAAAVL